MKDRKTGFSVDWGHLALLASICGVIIAYLLDARATSLKVNNLALVQPASIIALILAALVLPQCFKRRASGTEDEDALLAPKDSWRDLGKVAALAASFGAFTMLMETVGFDVATFVFVALGIYICGERKLWVIALFSAIFTAVIVLGYQLLVPYPFPLRVL